MSDYYNEPNKGYEAPEAEYEYKEYKEYAEYQAPEQGYGYEAPGYEAPEYWTPTYQEVQEKYPDEKYAEKQYLPGKTVEGYGKETADYVVGNEYSNVIETYEEQDVVEGGYGNDKMDAGKGDDLIYGFTKEHNPMDEKFAKEDYAETDWYTGGEGKDIYALGTTEYAYYGYNGEQDYAVIADYKIGEDAVMLYGTADNYIVGESATGEGEKYASIYWDHDANGSYSKGDDMMAVFEGYGVEDIAAAKNSWVYVAPEP
jgi:hypothetical protein